MVLDLSEVDAFPDGMVLAPDRQSVIIAFYNPRDVDYGEARQYRLADGQLLCVWRTEASPRVTCPLIMEYEGRVCLILTTAVEHMTAQQQQQHRNAGCLFIADTPFTSSLPQSAWRCPPVAS